MEAGSLGTETSTTDERFTRITGYFDQPPDVEELRNKLFEALRIYDLLESSLREVNLREIEDRDWLAEWKKDWQAVEVRRFVIAPPLIVELLRFLLGVGCGRLILSGVVVS